MSALLPASLKGLSFAHPWFGLLVLLPLLLPLLGRFLTNRPAALVFSNLGLVRPGASLRLATRWIPPALLVLSWSALSLAMMGPRLGHQETKVATEGIAIAMVLDCSLSMATPDMSLGDQLVSRADMVKEVFRDFVVGDAKKGLSGRENDLIGLVSFDRFVEELCPLTLDHSFVMDLMRDKVATFLDEADRLRKNGDPRHLNSSPINGTAAYDGVAMAADLLRKTEQSLAAALKKGEGGYAIKSKVMILLTDGADNQSSIGPANAAKVAREFGVKVHAIAVHGKPVRQDMFGLMLGGSGENYDDGPLQLIAKETGGRFYKATSPDSLARIYEEIDRMEKTRFSRQMTMEYEPVQGPFLLAGLAFLLAALLLRGTIHRELP